MARSIDPGTHPTRGFVPAQNEEERFLMRHVEDMARLAQTRGIPRYSSFLSDREQILAQAALNRAECTHYRFDGGFAQAERKVLCIEPPDAYSLNPICCVCIACRSLAGGALPGHRDYLGSLLGLNLGREALGDIILPPTQPGTAYVFVLENVADILCRELCSVGRTEVSVQLQAPDQLPDLDAAEHTLRTATVSSLRLDAVLAAMLHCSRGNAAELIAAGRVEINHLPATGAAAPVYPNDLFTVRGKGRFRLTALPGKSKKDRQIIEYFQYE